VAVAISLIFRYFGGFWAILRSQVRIPAMPIANSNLMAITIPIDADHHRSKATLD